MIQFYFEKLVKISSKTLLSFTAAHQKKAFGPKNFKFMKWLKSAILAFLGGAGMAFHVSAQLAKGGQSLWQKYLEFLVQKPALS